MLLEYTVLYLCCINLVALAVCGFDKYAAKRAMRRIPEKTLLVLALIGGSIGMWGGMYLFRHKTKHLLFTIGVPLILFLQVALGVFVRMQF